MDPTIKNYSSIKIPLIIHDPLRSMPEEYDAEIRSSIDFAPTLAHYLGLENTRNPFMGTSIFERRRKSHQRMATAALGPNETALINETRITHMGEPHNHVTTLDILNAYIGIVRQLEMEDKIWDGNYSNDHR